MMNQRDTWDEFEPPLLRREIEITLKILRNPKAADSDDIVFEMKKATREKRVDLIHKIYSKIWTIDEWPKKWCESICIIIHKKGDK